MPLWIEPSNEPQGEGNGWFPCEPGALGCHWVVWSGPGSLETPSDCDEIIECFEKKADAEAFVISSNKQQ